LLATDEAGQAWDISAVTLGPDIDAYLQNADKPPLRPLVQTRYSEGNPSFSPDGRWIAYTSNESDQVYVSPYPNVRDGRTQVSIDGGYTPMWSTDGDAIYYRHGSEMMMVPVATEPTFEPGRPQVLFDAPYAYAEDGSRQYDLSPDGNHFLMIKEIPNETVKLVYVENWTSRLGTPSPVAR